MQVLPHVAAATDPGRSLCGHAVLLATVLLLPLWGAEQSAEQELVRVEILRVVSLVDEPAAGQGSRLRVWMRLDPAASPLARIAEVTVDRAATAAGEALELQRMPSSAWLPANRLLARQERGADSRRGRPAPLMVPLDFRLPAGPVTGISVLEGALHGRIATQPAVLRMGDLSRWYDKTKQLDELPKSFITLKQTADDQVRLYFSNDFCERFVAMAFADADGQPLAANLLDLSRAEGKGSALYRLAVDQAASATVTYLPDLSTASWPFRFEQVTIPEHQGATP